MAMTPITEQRWRADVPDWRNDDNVSPHPSDVQITEAEGWQHTVATVNVGFGRVEWEEIAARANLIAAAPEMLALLRSLHADLADYAKRTEEVWSSGSIAFASMADDCARLIAKAEGRTDGA